MMSSEMTLVGVEIRDSPIVNGDVRGEKGSAWYARKG